MDEMKVSELNQRWQLNVRDIDDEEERERLAAMRLSPARCNAIKRLYAKLCSYMSHDPDNDPHKAWPKQTELARKLGWSESTVRKHMRMLEVLGVVWTNRTRHQPRGPRRGTITR